jgi:hypothetical protein
MSTHFISAEIDLKDTPLTIQRSIETELAKQGEPLRWAITAVDEQSQTMTVEAIVVDREELG